jgi:hypothetical protein
VLFRSKWLALLNAPSAPFEQALKRIQGILGKDKGNRVLTFYPEGKIRSCLGELMEVVPQVDESGFFKIGDVRYAGVCKWAEELSVGLKVLQRLITQSGIKGIAAKDCQGKIHKGAYFSESDIREMGISPCMLQAGKDGSLASGSDRYRSVQAWSELLKIHPNTIRTYLKKSGKTPLRIRDSIGHPRAMFSEKDVLESVSALMRDLPQADENGFFEIEGRKYGTVENWQDVLGISASSVRNRLKRCKVEGVSGFERGGKIVTFYSEAAMRKLCADLLRPMLQADESGFLVFEGICYGTVPALSRKLGIAKKMTAIRIHSAHVQFMNGKNSSGQVQRFYPEVAVREACASFMDPNLVRVGRDGFVMIGDARHGTVRSIARLIGVAGPMIHSRLASSGLTSVRGKDKMGRLADLWPEQAVRTLCSDILNSDPAVCGPDGFIEIGGVRYGSVGPLSRLLGLSDATVARRLASSDIVPICGKDIHGVARKLYSEIAVRDLCADILASDLVVVGDDGFAMINSVRHGTASSFAPYLGISQSMISRRLASFRLTTVRGKSRQGMAVDLYPEPGVREVCADLLDSDLPRCGPDGFVEISGVRHGTVKSLASLFGISDRTVFSRLGSSGFAPVRGKTKTGQLCDLYSEPQVREICADLLNSNLPVCGDDGFADIGGIRHGTIAALARSLKIDTTTICCHLRGSEVVAVRGRDSQGKLAKLWPEPVIRGLCSEVLASVAVADESGFVEISGVRHGTIPALARSIGVCAPTVTRYLEDSSVSPVRAKDCQGKPCNFFPEPDVRRICSEFLIPTPVADESGFIAVDGIRHGTISVLARVLGIGQRTVCRHIYRSTIAPVKGRDRTGRFYDFYPEPAVHALFDRLLILPVADKSGFLMVDDIRHGTLESLARLLGISTPTILSRIRGSGIVSVRGRVASGNACDFYPDPAVRELCKDLIERKKSNPKPR